MSSTTHILVVDDEPDYLDATIQLLQLEGFRVTGARSGADALQRLADPDIGKVHVFLIDYRMPGLNGGETLREIRAAGLSGHAILVSAAADIGRIAGDFAFDHQLRKPCDPVELLALIRQCAASDQPDNLPCAP